MTDTKQYVWHCNNWGTDYYPEKVEVVKLTAKTCVVLEHGRERRRLLGIGEHEVWLRTEDEVVAWMKQRIEAARQRKLAAIDEERRERSRLRRWLEKTP